MEPSPYSHMPVTVLWDWKRLACQFDTQRGDNNYYYFHNRDRPGQCTQPTKSIQTVNAIPVLIVTRNKDYYNVALHDNVQSFRCYSSNLAR